MPRSLWTEADDGHEDVDISSVEYPYIVVDFNSLHDSKEVKIERMRLLEKLWQNFNVVVWREPKLFKFNQKRIEEEINNFYDMNMVKVIECSLDRLRKYLVFNRTILLTEDAKVGKVLGWLAVNRFDYNSIFHDFPYLARRKG